MTDKTVSQITASPTYLMAIAKGVFHGLATLCGAIMAALAGTQWSGADGQTRFLIVVGIVASCSSTAAAFFDKTMARLSDGKTAIASGNTPPPFSPQTPTLLVQPQPSVAPVVKPTPWP